MRVRSWYRQEIIYQAECDCCKQALNPSFKNVILIKPDALDGLFSSAVNDQSHNLTII